MKYREFFEQKLIEVKNQEDLAYVFRYLKELDTLDYVKLLNEEVTEDNLLLLEEISQRLVNMEPAQYIVGNTDFYDLNLKVDQRVLIPRPETEELVDLILRENQGPKLRVLDLGTGSGAIGLSLKKARPDWDLVLADISQDALDLASDNAQANNLQVEFIQSDVFSNLSGNFDIIVSNPPYISFDEEVYMDESVIRHEPDLALYAENSGLLIYEKIAQGAPDLLKDQGKIYLEIGFKQASQVKKIFSEVYPAKRIRVFKDLAGLDRMVVVDEN
ncbi:peptide chain release factor N(5)-glutamine methyltransferase [Streptococcaceae bacterium ESL0687]|nr:peptide chain release factor N(5)-glutamine methyltransferase [Streptococcaceae bacterium ESL0687]